MEHNQKEMFSMPDPTSDTDPKVEEKTELKITAEEIKHARPTFSVSPVLNQGLSTTKCEACLEEIFNSEQVLYQGKVFHKDCAPFVGKTDLKNNPRIPIAFSLQASELALLLEIIEPHIKLRMLHDKLADILCEHGNSYVRCSFCGLVIERHRTLEWGKHTREVKEKTGAVVAITAGRFYSTVQNVECFCSEACDLNYSKKVKEAWDKAQVEKKEKAGVKKDSLSILMKMSRKDKVLQGKLMEILKNAGIDFGPSASAGPHSPETRPSFNSKPSSNSNINNEE
jgi:hypothetical protein